MYLHAGNGRTVRTRDVIGIFDLDNASMSAVTRRMLAEGGVDAARFICGKAAGLYNMNHLLEESSCKSGT